MNTKKLLNVAKVLYFVGMLLVGIKPTYGWDPVVIPGHTEETVGSLILKQEIQCLAG